MPWPRNLAGWTVIWRGRWRAARRACGPLVRARHIARHRGARPVHPALHAAVGGDPGPPRPRRSRLRSESCRKADGPDRLYDARLVGRPLPTAGSRATATRGWARDCRRGDQRLLPGGRGRRAGVPANRRAARPGGIRAPPGIIWRGLRRAGRGRSAWGGRSQAAAHHAPPGDGSRCRGRSSHTSSGGDCVLFGSRLDAANPPTSARVRVGRR
jgi:hypothetical protein